MAFAATWMDLEMIVLSEVSQKEKDKHHDITYMWNLKYNTNELIPKTETDSDIENRHVVAGGGPAGEGSIGSLELANANC